MSQREYAEDTIWWSIKNATEYAPHRRMVLFFHTNSSTLSGHPNPLRWVDNTGQVWDELRGILESYLPNKIIINVDQNIAFGGGLHAGELDVIRVKLGEQWMSRMVNEPMVGIEYVATRVPGQLAYYHNLQEITWALIEEAFSERVIQPGVTTTEVSIPNRGTFNNYPTYLVLELLQDVEWWYREKMQTLNVSTWNHPRVSVITPESFPGWEGTKDTIQEGDLLHVDYGITAMGMNTDTQQLAYVLRSTLGETEIPKGLQEGLKKANRMQDIVLKKMEAGKTGNQVLKECLDQMKQEGLRGQIYSHPIGDWGHSAGAVIGMSLVSATSNLVVNPLAKH